MNLTVRIVCVPLNVVEFVGDFHATVVA
jgi:hypothetical protein